MKDKFIRIITCFVLFFTLLLIWNSNEVAAQSGGKWWDKFGEPKYGGTLVIRNAAIQSGSFDPNVGFMMAGPFAGSLWLEGLAFFDWTLDREVWSYPCGFTPLEYLKGQLAESWEQTDPLTITIHIRKGVHWQKKPPVNGRELVAKDVEFNYDRIFGTGNGYTIPNPMLAGQLNAIKRIVATDKYTVQVKLKSPSAMGMYQLFNTMYWLVPPEWVALGGPPSNKPAPMGPPPGPGGPPPKAIGPLSDWKKVQGTGPFILTGFVSGNSATYSRNPDYWGFDERHPKNKLPYVDKVVQLAIPDTSTAMAAMRTKKIDMWTDMMGALTWQQGALLAKTNPDINQAMLPHPAAIITLRSDTKPFTDIRVRKAMQMAVNLPLIAKTYYNNSKFAKPVGLISPEIKGWAIPFEKWPQELKEEYSYNPEKAKKLLSEAGFPRGFTTNCLAPSNQDTQLLQLIKSQFKEIGVDMTIKMMDPTSYAGVTSAGKFDQMVYSDGMAGMSWAPAQSLSFRISNFPQNNYTYNNDTAFDKMYNNINSISDAAKMKQLCAEADQYVLKQHWSVNILPSDTPLAWQPYVKGYSGEILVDNAWASALRARVWIDKDVK